MGTVYLLCAVVQKVYLHRSHISGQTGQPHEPEVGPGTGIVEVERELSSSLGRRHDQSLWSCISHSECSLHKEHSIDTPVQLVVDKEAANMGEGGSDRQRDKGREGGRE